MNIDEFGQGHWQQANAVRLARGITLVDPGVKDHRAQANELLAASAKGREALAELVFRAPGGWESTFYSKVWDDADPPRP